MRRTRLVGALAGLLLLGAPLASTSVAASDELTARTLVKTASGNLETYVDNFVAGFPGVNSYGYVAPTSTERATFTRGVDQVLLGDYPSAASTLDPLKYDVVRYTDTAVYPNRTVTLLRERRVDGKYTHGWGLYAFGRSGSRVVVEVPHPRADLYTEKVGVLAFRRADAKALYVAGTHRYANGEQGPLDDMGHADAPADMAHVTDSIFHAVHNRLLASNLRVFQPHGFGNEGYADADYHEVVVSAGATPTAFTYDVAAATGRHFRTCVSTGPSVCYFFASHNEQGKTTRAAGGEFIHVEAYRPIRDDATLRTTLAHSVADVLEPYLGDITYRQAGGCAPDCRARGGDREPVLIP